MRIAIVTTQAPFIQGGAEMHAESLRLALIDNGYQAEIVSLPFKGSPPQTVLDHMLAARATDLTDCVCAIDLVICLKFPAWFVHHPNKVYWVLHQHRDAYDLWDNGISDFLHHDIGPVVRDAITTADTHLFKNAKKIFANSQNVAERLERYNGIKASPLYHPPPGWKDLRAGKFGNYIYYPSRIGPMKRQSLVIDALAHADESVRVVFSGAPDDPAYLDLLKQRAHDLGVEDRIIWKGFISRAEMIDLYAGCAGVVFPPIDEDLGYITLEAMLCEKPVLTTRDAGEPARIITDGVEGFVVDPTPQDIGQAMSKMMNKPQKMGKSAYRKFQSMNISWDHAVKMLVGQQQQKKPVPEKISEPVNKSDTPQIQVPDYYIPQHDNSDDHDPATYWRGRAVTPALQALQEFAATFTATPALTLASSRSCSRRTLLVTHAQPADTDTYYTGSDIVVLDGYNTEHTPMHYPEQYFDSILMDQALEQLTDNPAYVLYMLQRMLKPQGDLFILTQGYIPNNQHIQFAPGQRPAPVVYTDKNLRKLLAGTGFDIRHSEQYKISATNNALFVRAVKTGTLQPALLRELYRYDPGQLMAKLSRLQSADADTLTIRAHNTGWSAWTPDTMYLGLYQQHVTQNGVDQCLCIPLASTVEPTAYVDFKFYMDEHAPATIDTTRWIFDLCQTGCHNTSDNNNRISRGGLANTVTLLANNIMVPCAHKD